MVKFSCTKERNLIKICFNNIANLDKIRILFKSTKNSPMSKATDIAPNDKIPERYDHLKKKYPLHEIYFPVIDIDLDDDMKGVAEFSGSNYTNEEYCLLNKMFRNCRKPLASKVVFDADDLEYWENQLFVDSKNVLERFYVIKEIDVSSKDSLSLEVRLLTERWSGEIVAIGVKADNSFIEIGKAEFNDDSENTDIYTAVKPASLKRERVVEALEEAVGFLERSQVKNKRSKAYKGLYLYYDYDERIFRHPTWIWTWSIAIRALLDAEKSGELASKYDKGQLLKLADEIGRSSLKFQMLDKSHPAYGLLMCRFDADLQYEEGSSGFLSPADGLFMAGYGWMPLYRATGNEEYLEATKLMVQETGRILDSYDIIIEQDYITAENEWKDWIMDESGFGMIGFAELYKVLPESWISDIARDYIDRLIDVFERGDGYWNRIWWKSIQKIEKTSYNTKGFGWAMIGLINSYKMLGDRKYLEKARKMADNIISEQQNDGKWDMHLKDCNERIGTGGICEKSTALWSFLLYELYEITGDCKYLNSARKALYWCIGHQYTGKDVFGRGAIPISSAGSGINFRYYFNMCTSYAVSFMAAALVKELEISS